MVKMGHSSGLEDSYLKLSEEQVLEGNDKMGGYICAINALTINDERTPEITNSQTGTTKR